MFGLITTVEESRLLWLPDLDPVAASTADYTPNSALAHNYEIPADLHGTGVLTGSDSSLHSLIASAIKKAYTAVVKEPDSLQLPPLSERVLLRTDGQGGTVLAKLSDGVTSLTFASPNTKCKSFFLLKDCRVGAQGRVWVAASQTTNTMVGCVCVLKFTSKPKKKYLEIVQGPGKRKVDALISLNPAERIDWEQGFWQAMGYTVRKLGNGSEPPALVLPLGITASYDETTRTVQWDRTTLLALQSLLAATEYTAITDALDSTTPQAALRAACADLITRKVWHLDIEWRHVAMFCVLTKSRIYGSIRSVKPGFVDYGYAKYIDRNNKNQAEATINGRMTALLDAVN